MDILLPFLERILFFTLIPLYFITSVFGVYFFYHLGKQTEKILKFLEKEKNISRHFIFKKFQFTGEEDTLNFNNSLAKFTEENPEHEEVIKLRLIQRKALTTLVWNVCLMFLTIGVAITYFFLLHGPK